MPRPLTEAGRKLAYKRLGKRLRECGFAPTDWPLAKPWPEVQRLALMRLQRNQRYKGGLSTHEGRDIDWIQASAADVASITARWIETPWGALRMHPRSEVGTRRRAIYRVALDFHWNYVRTHPYEAREATDTLMERMPLSIGDLLTDDWDEITTGGVLLRGKLSQVEKKFRRFCRHIEDGSIDESFARAEEDLRWERNYEVLEELKLRGTSADALTVMLNHDPEQHAKMQMAGFKLKGPCNAADIEAFERVANEVMSTGAPGWLTRFEPSTGSLDLADVLAHLFVPESNAFANTSELPRDRPWLEVLAAERDANTGEPLSKWSDDHWLAAPWGVLRLRFDTSEGAVRQGSAHFMFREARFDELFDDLTQIAAFALADRFPLLNAEWPQHGQPVYSLGLTRPLDEDLGHLEAMLRNSYVEHILFSQVVLTGMSAPGIETCEEDSSQTFAADLSPLDALDDAIAAMQAPSMTLDQQQMETL